MAGDKLSSNKRFQDFAPEDWRKRPRRDASGLRSCMLNVRLTANEMAAIKEQAELCNMSVSDYVVCRCLRIARRVQMDNVVS